MTATILTFPVRHSATYILIETQQIRERLSARFPGLTWGEPVVDEETQYIDGYSPGGIEPSVTIAHERGRGREPWVAFGPLVKSTSANELAALAAVLGDAP